MKNKNKHWSNRILSYQQTIYTNHTKLKQLAIKNIMINKTVYVNGFFMVILRGKKTVFNRFYNCFFDVFLNTKTLKTVGRQSFSQMYPLAKTDTGSNTRICRCCAIHRGKSHMYVKSGLKVLKS